MNELLQENRAQGWADAQRCPAGHMRDRIIAVRQALLEKRAVPAPSAEYRFEAELRYAATTHVRKVNTLPASIIHKPIILSLEERLLATAFVMHEQEATQCAAEQKRWDNDPEFQAYLASAEPIRWRRV